MAKPSPPVWDIKKNASENAARNLPQMAGEYFKAGRDLERRRASFEVLHQFRLETKRFRYTLELFRPCYGPGLDKRLAALRKIQDLLGEINDCVTTQNLLGRKQKTLAQFLQRRITRKRRELNRYWQSSFDAAGHERWWRDYLERFAKKG
jgi:CHAD domain-containing protein